MDQLMGQASQQDAGEANLREANVQEATLREANLHAANLREASLVVAAGRPARVQGQPLNEPITMTSAYFSQGVPGPQDLLYTRYDTQSWHAFESTLAALEGAQLPALVYSSGMAAVAAALSLLPGVGADASQAPGIVVLPQHAYQGSLTLTDAMAHQYGIQVRRVDIADTDAVIAAMRGAHLALLESPTNPMLEIADLPALCAAAQDMGVITVVDNTFATPLLQQPLALGADVVLHSATKYLAGHSDVVLGALVTSKPELREKLDIHRRLHGAIAGPFEVWLAVRGIRTLAVRLDKAQANAVELARRLAQHPDVRQVRHPSLPQDPGHERAKAQMSGFGAIIGLCVGGSAQVADALVAATRLWTPATSLGGVESTLERRRRFSTEAPSVPEDFLRLSVGIEDVEDLWADLEQAVKAATAA